MASRTIGRSFLAVTTRISVARRIAARASSTVTSLPVVRASPFVRLRCLSYNQQKYRSPLSRVGWIANAEVAAPAYVTPCRYYGDDPKMTPRELEDRVINVLQLFDKIDPDKVTLESHFINDLGLDSLDVVEIVMAFEDEFGVEIDDDQAEKIMTPMDAVNFLKREMDIQ